MVSLCGREGGAFEGACWHAGTLTRGDPGIAASAQDMMGSGPSLIRCACQKVRPDPVFGPDDETTAVIFIKGKVDAITSGDTSKTVIEVRRR